MRFCKLWRVSRLWKCGRTARSMYRTFSGSKRESSVRAALPFRGKTEDTPQDQWFPSHVAGITPYKSASIRQPHWHRHLDVKRPTRRSATPDSPEVLLGEVEWADSGRRTKRKQSLS